MGQWSVWWTSGSWWCAEWISGLAEQFEHTAGCSGLVYAELETSCGAGAASWDGWADTWGSWSDLIRKTTFTGLSCFRWANTGHTGSDAGDDGGGECARGDVVLGGGGVRVLMLLLRSPVSAMTGPGFEKGSLLRRSGPAPVGPPQSLVDKINAALAAAGQPR